MLKSLRARLLLWYSLILIVVIIGYAGSVTYLYRESLLQQVDTNLGEEITTLVSAVSLDIDGTFDLNLPPAYRASIPDALAAGRYYAIWNSEGQPVDQSDPLATPGGPPPSGTTTRLNRRERTVEAPGGARIMAGQRLDTLNDAVRDLALTITGVGVLVLGLSLLGGFVLVGRALSPVARISETAGAMIGGDLDARIPVKGTASELEQVARALNEAFDRMRLAADHQRQFTADASHELRTPLATLRAEFDWALTRPRQAEEYKASIEKGRKAVERMSELADRLLALARPGSGKDLERTPVDLVGVVEAAIDLLSPLAAAHQVAIHAETSTARVVGVRSLLIDAVCNLLKNGIEYNRRGGHVTIKVWSDREWAHASVRDNGVGIDPADLPRIFERFYRADRSRTRGGAGLGLAIVRSIIEDHGGTVSCTSEAGTGTEFLVRLPVADVGHTPA